MVSPEIPIVFDRLAGFPIRNTLLAPLPLITSLAAPGPTMFRVLSKLKAPLVSVIMAGQESEKLIVSPSAALDSAERSVPAPLSAVLVTVMVAAPAICAAISAIRRRSALFDFM